METKKMYQEIDPIVVAIRETVKDLNKERKRRKLTYKEVGRRIGIHEKNVYTVFAGRNMPVMHKFFKIYRGVTDERRPIFITSPILDECIDITHRYLSTLPKNSKERRRFNNLLDTLNAKRIDNISD